jgi:hypothetical protein
MSRHSLCALAGLTFFAAVSILAAPAQAGDALYDSTEQIVEIQVIDTRTDSFVKGSPVSVRTKDDDERELDAVRAELLKKAWLHEAADGTPTLAVLIETVDAHEFHAGPNRRFMAVTKQLSQSR